MYIGRQVVIRQTKFYALRGRFELRSFSDSSASALLADNREGDRGVGVGELGVDVRGEDIGAGDTDLNRGDRRN
jgi:hypothetical protein